MKVGYAFGDHVRTEKVKKYRFPTYRGIRMNRYFLLVLLCLLSCALVYKLSSLQLMQGAYYRNLSDTNRIRTRVVHAPRGIIFDRHNEPLVLNMPGFRKVDGATTKIVTHSEALELLAKGDKRIEVDSLRKYIYGETTAHVLGYIGQISAREIKESRYKQYNPTDMIGKDGIEKQYETLLRGVDGKQLIEIDALGNEVRLLGQTDPVAGRDITLNLDSSLQKAVWSALLPHPKAVVIASTPQGEILSLVSKPAFDPNLFTLDATYQSASESAYPTLQSILGDGVHQPLLNRAIGGVYPPGSTFKLVTAAAGLNNHIISPSYTVKDTGILKIGAFSFANWYFTQYGRTDGEVNVVKAISRSNDIFFYKLAEKVRVGTLAQTARGFGIGRPTGVDLPGEVSGNLPDETWKEKQIGERWYLGDTYHYGIGQGYLLTTPMQVHAFTIAFANGGTLYQPSLVKRPTTEVLARNLLTPETTNTVRSGMIQSCQEGGVAWPLFHFAVKNDQLAVDGKDIRE